jgi:hypothetical protein
VQGNRREILLENIKAKLEAIRTGAEYSFKGKLRSVQRYRHETPLEGAIYIGNYLADSPTIVIRTLEGQNTSGESVGTWTHRITIDNWFIITQGEANDDDLNNALADMERALFVNNDDNFGVQGRLISYTDTRVDPVLDMPTAGVHLIITLTFSTVKGDPSLLG